MRINKGTAMPVDDGVETLAVPAISFKGVSYTYPSGLDAAVESVSLEVQPGERLGILGPNGGGKTTLIRLLIGLLSPSHGSIRVFGESPAEARRHGAVAYVAQRLEAELTFPMRAEQVVRMGALRGLGPFERLSGERLQLVERAIEVTGVGPFATNPIGTLSGGQVQRVMIARALAANPRILVLDEPTIGVDPAGQIQFSRLLKSARDRFSLTIVIVSHDVKAIAAGCDRVACLSRTLHSHIAPSGLTPQVLAEVFQHDVAAFFGDVHVDAHTAAECTDPSHKHPTGTRGDEPLKGESSADA